MNFLAPLFLLGGLAVALPIIFHLIRRSTRERTIFSSLMFLAPSPPQLSKKSRLEHIILLALRCLAFVLLATAFARPFWKHAFPETPSAKPPRRVLVMLDASASMQRQQLWRAACDKAEAIVRQAGPADQVALFTFDRQLKPLFTFDEWNAAAPGDRSALASSRLANVKPGWSSTRLDSALLRAAEMISETDKDIATHLRQVVLISDLQEGTQLHALQGHEWPKGFEVVTEPIVPRPASNAGIQLVTDTTDANYVVESTVRVRISNASDSKREQFQIAWTGVNGVDIGKPVTVYVPPGRSRVMSLPAPATNTPADHITLRGDDEPFDNTLFVIPPQRSRTTVLFFGSGAPEDNRQPFFFLQRALQDTKGQEIRLLTDQTATGLQSVDMENATLFIVTDPIRDSQLEALRTAVEDGKTLLFAPTSVAAAPTLSKLLRTEVAMQESRPEQYAMLGEIAFRHPLFAPFADARFNDFTKIHFWRYRRMDASALAGAHVLARLDNGDPVIFEIPAGKGRVIVFASCWHPADSQLGLSSKFIPLLYSLLELSGAPTAPPPQYFVGETVPLPADRAVQNSSRSIRLPDGSQVPLKAGDTNFTGALVPGIYSVMSGTSATRFAINLEPAESRTAPMPADQLERLGVPGPRSAPVASTEIERKHRLRNNDLESRQKLWRWFILAALVVLGMETWLAGRTARRALLQEIPI